MRISYDMSEVVTLAVDFDGCPARLQLGAGKAFRQSAEAIDRGMSRDGSGHRYLPHLGRATTREEMGYLDWEIGFDTDKWQGSIAHIIAYGSINNAPVFDPYAALRRETPNLLRKVGVEAENAVLSGRGS